MAKPVETRGWYPKFGAWMQEVRPNTSLEENQIAVVAMLKPIIIRRLAGTGMTFFDNDVDNCCDIVFGRIEEKIERREFAVDLALNADWQESRTQVIVPGTREVNFSFAIADPGVIRQGFQISLRGAGGVWEDDGLVERFDSRNGTLWVAVSTNRLRHGHGYSLDLLTAGSVRSFADQKFHVIQIEALHLLQSSPFAIVVRHRDLQANRRYNVRFCDMDDGVELGSILDLTCEASEHLPIWLPYDFLRHEQNIRVEASSVDGLGPSYFCCVRAVQHGTWQSRIGYVQQVARNVASERARALSKNEQEGLGEGRAAKPDDERQRMANIVYQRVINQARNLIKRLPKNLQLQLVEHYIEDRSWAEIATRYKISEAKVKQDSSRALRELSKTIAPEPGSDHSGLVKWLKEMLSEILHR